MSRPAPLGATFTPAGVNFSVFSRNATRVELLLFNRVDQKRPTDVIPLTERSYHYWHGLVPGLKAGQIYAFRAHGPFDPAEGLRFDPSKTLLDPYGRAVVFPDRWGRQAASDPGDNTASAMKSVLTAPGDYDWEGDVPLQRPYSRTVIYEMHVAGFTRHPNSGVSSPGTYAGLVEKIPYLKDLGITAVELLPVFAFDPQDAPKGLLNYWGYAPVSFFAPHPFYSSDHDPLGVLREFKDMVKALHRAGLEVILDVVYNHTAEGDEKGPTFGLKGLSNRSYYILEKDRSRYANFTGTGNALNAGQAVVRRLILDSLRYWVNEMHVDGFRFDLASILARDDNGKPLENPPVLWDIESDPVLAGTKLIAEAWDAGGLYQVGSFVGDAWQEWNGKFRDDVRCFLKGDDRTVRRFAQRILGSPDVYAHENREAEQSINFVTCHDGFTLNDLVSYNQKDNLANREQNRDGSDSNFSWNCGVEGPSSDPQIEALRERQMRNFLGLTLLSLGTPMLTMGDEVRRTQQGNNNAYCQDNPLSWFNWDLVEHHRGLHRFVRELVQGRLHRPDDDRRGLTLSEYLEKIKLDWHGIHLGQPDWGDSSHSLAATLESEGARHHFMVNAYWEPLEFELPEGEWLRWIDTSLPSPEDITERGMHPKVTASSYLVSDRSLVVLVCRDR